MRTIRTGPLDYQAVEAELSPRRKATAMCRRTRQTFSMRCEPASRRWRTKCFGNHAAIGCHLANYAYFKNTIATWDAGENDSRINPQTSDRKYSELRTFHHVPDFSKNVPEDCSASEPVPHCGRRTSLMANPLGLPLGLQLYS